MARNNRTKPSAKKRSKEPAVTSRRAESDSNLTITVSGPSMHVRDALTALTFKAAWNGSVTRQIALDETLVADADLDDELGGPRVALFSQDVRDLYRQRCVGEAARRGHPIDDSDSIPAGTDTTVMEVGDALFKNARP